MKAFTITYKVGNGLYVNMTNRCTNACDFCIRNNGDGAYGSDSLWLSREPSAEECISEILARLPEGFSELVFCGYGEPAVRLQDCRKVALAVREGYPELEIRINTNGQADLIHGYDTTPLFRDAFDVVSISLNAPSAEGYDRVCHSVYGERAFESILTFAKNVKNYVPNTMFSVVRDTISDSEITECERIARECGVALRVRELIRGDQ